MGSLRIVFKVLMKTAFVLGVVFELIGCTAPVTVASFAADGASYAASGKSLGDHALSTVSGQDCSALGMLSDGVLCHDRTGKTLVRIEQATPPLASAPVEVRAASVDNSEATFLALGIFSDWENADHTVVMGGFYSPLIVPLDVDAKGNENPSFWVVAGHPLAGGDGKLPVSQAKKIGFDGARTVVLCRGTYRPAPCVAAVDEAPTADQVNMAIDSKLKAASRAGSSLAQR
jgi:hypothetical protein